MEKLNTWKVINLLRVIGAVLGWIMVAMAPVEDQTAGMRFTILLTVLLLLWSLNFFIKNCQFTIYFSSILFSYHSKVY